MQLASDAAGCFARTCAWVDARLHSARSFLVFSMALCSGVAPFVDPYLPGGPWTFHPLTWLLSVGLGFLVLILFVARLGALRDEDGKWQTQLLIERMRVWLPSLVDGVSAWWSLDAQRKVLVLLRGATSLGVLTLSTCSAGVMALDVLAALSRVTGLIEADEGTRYETQLAWAQGLVLFGLVSSSVGTLVLRWKLAHPPTRSGGSSTLPPVLDCNDQRTMRSLAAQAQDPALGALLSALADWKPQHHDKEQGYQLSLLRFLKVRLPELGPDEEVPLPSPTGRRPLRADITVGPVLIEMKRALSTSTVQRAVGQLGMYIEAWKRGPLLLLVCDTDPALSQGWLRQEVERLRLQGPVSLVLARTGRR